MFLGMDIYSWIAAIVIALIVTFLPVSLPVKIVLAMAAMACFYFGRKYCHDHKNGGAETPSMTSAESEAMASGLLKALGGKGNIIKMDYCATRLRFEVHSYASVDEAAAKAAGAEGVIRRPRTPVRWSLRAMCRPCTTPCASSCKTSDAAPPGAGLSARPGGIF